MTIYVLTNSEDLFLTGDGPTINTGTCTEIVVGTESGGAKKRGLIRFPLDSIPPNVVTVNSAVVSLMLKHESNTTDRLWTFYRSLVEWYEGVQCWQIPDEEDGSTWDERNGNTLDSLDWVGGAGGASGQDWYATKTDDEIITGVDVRFEWDVKADIEDFLDGTYDNNGWWIIGYEGENSTKKVAYSAESATEEYRPTLTLDLDFGTGEIPAGVVDCCDGSNYLLMARKGIVP